MASTRKKRVQAYMGKHWFLITLITVLPLGVLGANQLAWLNYYAWPRTLLVCVVMGLMALPIPFELIRQSLARPWPAILASIINMLLIPLLAWAASLTLSKYLGGGLIVAAAIPCTLASAAVWTRRAGGDDTVAILVTLITNGLCVIITPIWLVFLLKHQVVLDVNSLVFELLLVVLLPMIVAQSMRLSTRVAAWSHKHRLSLSTVCQVGILIMVLSGAVQMGLHLNSSPDVRPTHDAFIVADAESSRSEMAHANASVQAMSTKVGVTEILWTTFLTMAIHLLAMVSGWYLAAATGVARPQQIGIAIAGSQKTLMIGLKMALDCGVSILPMVAFHVGQLLLDTVIADRMRKHSPD